MIKLFIVEDENLMRQGIVHMLNWLEHGFVIVGQAANGHEALEKIEASCPDIVITDVKMPVMDGITLTKELVYRYPKLKIIILSSHSDFQYVRDTLRLGAYDYILKQEINAENILVVLNRAAAFCEKDKKEALPYSQQSQIFCNLLRTPYQTPEVCSQIIHQAKINVQNDNISLVLFVVSSTARKELSKDFLESIQTILTESLTVLSFPNVFITDDSELLLAYNACGEDDSATVSSICSAFLHRIENEFNISFCAFIGRRFCGYENIYSIYHHLIQLEQLTFYMQDKKIFRSEDYPNDFLNKPFDYPQLRSMVEELQLADIFHITENLLNECIKTNHFFNVSEFKKQIIDIINYIAFRLTEKGFRMDDMNGFRVSYIQGIERASNYSLLLLALKNALDSFVAFMENSNSFYQNLNIKKAIDYINENYKENISLATAANYLYLNKNYLSSLFKNETNISFTDYLMNVRIQHAKALLKEKQISVADIGTEAGYPNTSYFIQVFKKSTGMKPMEYAKKAGKV